MSISLIIKTVFFVVILLFMLHSPSAFINYAFDGLSNWATNMIPTLFPFMMLSSIMISCGLDKTLTTLIRPLLKPVFGCSTNAIYAILMGFLCGFPMGAKVTCELYHNQKIDEREANLLLGFCNNIGPAYFLGIVSPILYACGFSNRLPFLLGLYLIPFLYGMVLFRIHPHEKKQDNLESLNTPMRPIEALRAACIENTQSIILLGGYVTFINAIRALLLPLPFTNDTKAILGSMIEINSGIQDLYLSSLTDIQKIFFIMVSLSFSSISCFIQAAGFILREKLSFRFYVQNHCIVTVISALYYGICLFLYQNISF